MFARGASALAAVFVLAAVAAADPAPKEPTPKVVDIKAYKEKLVILKDADGGIYAATNEKGSEPHIFYGTPKALYEAVYEGSGGRNGDIAWSVSVKAPRAEFPFQAQFQREKDGSYRVSCGANGQIRGLTELTGDEAKKILDKAQFLTSTVIRRPHLLARDDRGVYYYVDILRDIYGGNGHRVWVGKKGAMKLLGLSDIASDTAGEVYSTKTGDLRLVKTTNRDGSETKSSAQWIRGEKRTELIYLDVYMNQALVYRDLGIYQYPHTICGDI